MLAIVALLLAFVAMNVWATVVILLDVETTIPRKRRQTIFVWAVPILAAFIALYARRDQPERLPDKTYESMSGDESSLEELGRIIAKSGHQESSDLIHTPPDRGPKPGK